MKLVFVSSTFKDMQFERDMLKSNVAPRMDAFLAKYGENVHFGDLRWGVNTSELESVDSSKKVLKVCLDEIDDARPYMIVFIGERYGWIPSCDLLKEAMNMKGIDNLPDDISVTNLEIEYGALMNPDFEGRVLFYFRDLDTSKMSEEERKIYEAESPLHKQKLLSLKAEIEKKYPDFIIHYKAEYDPETHSIKGLEPLMDQIYNDLERVFDLDLERLNNLPKEVRTTKNADAYFERFYKNAYMREDNELYEYDLDFQEFIETDENNLPMLTLIDGDEGSGRKTNLAVKYKLSLGEQDILSIPFVYKLDEFSNKPEDLIGTIIFHLEEKLGYPITHDNDEYSLANLLYDIRDKLIDMKVNIFVMNADKGIIKSLNILQSYIPVWYPLIFYVEWDNYDEFDDVKPQFRYQIDETTTYLEDEERIPLIKAICKSKHKELSSVVMDKIITKEESYNPLYLSLIVERLLMLDHEDFTNIQGLGDGMDAINRYMISIIDKTGNSLKEIAEDLLKELIERTNKDMAVKLIAILTGAYHLNKTATRLFFEYMGWPFNDLDYSLFKRLIPSLFKITPDDNAPLYFKNDEISEAASSLMKKYGESEYYKELKIWLKELKPSPEMPIKYIHECLANYYYYSGDVEGFFDSFLSVYNLKSGDRLNSFTNAFLSNVHILTKPYLDILNKVYVEDIDNFDDEVDDLLIEYLIEGKITNYVLLLNTYNSYFINERNSLEQNVNFNKHQIGLAFKLVEAYKVHRDNVVLENFAKFYSFLTNTLGIKEINFINDEDTLLHAQELIKFNKTENVNGFVQQLKDEDKLRVKLLSTSLIDTFRNLYEMTKEEDDDTMLTQCYNALRGYIYTVQTDPKLPEAVKRTMTGKEEILTERDLELYGLLPMNLMMLANITFDMGDDSHEDYFNKSINCLKAYFSNLDPDVIKNDFVVAGIGDTIDLLIQYVDKAEYEIDEELSDLINVNLRVMSAYHPGNYKLRMSGVRFAASGKINDEGYEALRFYLPNVYQDLCGFEVISFDDILDFAVTLSIYCSTYFIDVGIDYLMRNILVHAYDISEDEEEAMTDIMDIVDVYVDELEEKGLKEPFLIDLIDHLVDLYEDENKARKVFTKEIKDYLKNM